MVKSNDTKVDKAILSLEFNRCNYLTDEVLQFSDFHLVTKLISVQAECQYQIPLLYGSKS